MNHLVNGLLQLAMNVVALDPNQSAMQSVDARVYNPSCPVYFSVLHADIRFNKSFARERFCRNSSVKRVDLVYSYRNAWTKHSWDRDPATRAALLTADDQSDTSFPKASEAQLRHWSVFLNGEEVASRSSYQFTHIEFAWTLQCEDGRVEWDNGGRAPLGFYSAALPSVHCPMSAFENISWDVFASGQDYE